MAFKGCAVTAIQGEISKPHERAGRVRTFSRARNFFLFHLLLVVFLAFEVLLSDEKAVLGVRTAFFISRAFVARGLFVQ